MVKKPGFLNKYLLILVKNNLSSNIKSKNYKFKKLSID